MAGEGAPTLPNDGRRRGESPAAGIFTGGRREGDGAAGGAEVEGDAVSEWSPVRVRGMEGGLEDHEEEEGIRLTVAETRWVDGSEVDSASPPSYLVGDGEEEWDLWERSEGERMPLRRRLIREVKRADSFDKEAMGIGDDYKYRQKV